MCTLFSIGGERVEVDAGQVGNPLSHGAESGSWPSVKIQSRLHEVTCMCLCRCIVFIYFLGRFL